MATNPTAMPTLAAADRSSPRSAPTTTGIAAVPTPANGAAIATRALAYPA